MTNILADPAMSIATPSTSSPGRHVLDLDQVATETQSGRVEVDLFAASQRSHDIHDRTAGGEPTETTDQRDVDAHVRNVGGPDSPPAEPNRQSATRAVPARLEDALLLIYADALDDFEKTRIATENRIRSLAQIKGLEHSPESKRLAGVVDNLAKMEHQIVLDLQKAMRNHPLGPWVKAQKGVGEKQAARLLATIGDPYIDHRTGQPRTVSQLWAMCGYHVLPAQPRRGTHSGTGGEGSFSGSHTQTSVATQPVHGVAARRRKGIKANWNSVAKSRAFLIAESCMKAGGPYRDTYDKRKANTEGRVHVADCPPCKAKAGEPWKPGHCHADALRVTAKEILKDLWRESRRIHEAAS